MNRRLLLVSLGAQLLSGVAVPVWAKGGDDHGGESEHDGSGKGEGGSDDGSDNSGSGSGNSGSGSGSGSSGSGSDHGGSTDSGSGSGGSSGGGGGPPSGSSGGSGSGERGRTGPRRDSGDGLRADVIAVTYSGGESERVNGRTYELQDARGRVVERRAATSADLARLAAARGDLKVFKDSRTGAVETVDRRGWRERMAGGTYVLTDPKGRVVRRRALRAEDLRRVGALTD